MLILAIETSCDETSVAVVRDGTEVLSCIIHSQANLHAATGGVVPEVAAREHVIYMVPVLRQAMNEAKVCWGDIDRIAVTKEPGLLPSLLIGLQTAKTVGFAKNIPVQEIHHTMGHVYSNWLERNTDEILFPVMVLTVSGGHNDLIFMRGHDDMKTLGTTRDDAAGEAFDKVARLLKLGYPGGPKISKVGEKGSDTAFDFPRAWLSDKSFFNGWDKKNYDFSFSGLKTAVLKEITGKDLSDDFTADVAASFEKAVCEVLCEKAVFAAQQFGAKELHLAGGVSANTRLRNMVRARLSKDIIVRYPTKMTYCTDNAAMIATAGYFTKF